MANVEIYIWSTCPFCRRAKQLLDRKQVAYTEHVLDGDEAARDRKVAPARAATSAIDPVKAWYMLRIGISALASIIL